MSQSDLYELDIVKVAAEIATQVPGTASVRLFGSRKYPGKVRSDLDLLITGPSNTSLLLNFRNKFQHYKPLDLWLANGDTAVSSVNGSILPIRELRCFDLFPDPSGLPDNLRRQTFRADIDYKMTIIPPGTYTPIRGDQLGLRTRMPMLLDAELIQASEATVRIVENAFAAVQRMRNDGNAKRGKGTQLTMLNEYDIQNFVELVLSPIIPLRREPFTVECEGVRRTADFSFANGRLVVELKMPKDKTELASVLKDARGALSCYLDHPGVEIALAILTVTPEAHADKNSIESFHESRGHRSAIMRVMTLPAEILVEVDAERGTTTKSKVRKR
jgi:DpnII restriction endonuclease